MSKVKLVLMITIAALTAGAITSATASAESCGGGTHFLFCFYPGNEPMTSESGLGKLGLARLAVNIGTVEVRLHCTGGSGKGVFESLGVTKGEADFLGCTVEKPSDCTIENLLLARFTGQLSNGTTDIVAGAGVGEEFLTLLISGSSCPIVGSYPIRGLQTLEFPEGETGKVEHEIVAKKSGSKLKLGDEQATFSDTAVIHLSSNREFLIMSGE